MEIEKSKSELDKCESQMKLENQKVLDELDGRLQVLKEFEYVDDNEVPLLKGIGVHANFAHLCAL
jgi:cell division GTPase FtsZ